MARRSVVVVLVALFVAMLAACAWDWTVVPKADVPDGSGATDAGDAGDAGGGIDPDGVCSSNAECRSDELCLFPDGRCGSGARGRCSIAPVAKECTAPEEPPYAACGCDGKTGTNGCAVQMTRTDLSIDAACTAPPDTFRCGFYFCPRTEICYESRREKEVGFSCAPWPCSEQSCGCKELATKCPGAACTTDSTGATTVVCTQ